MPSDPRNPERMRAIYCPHPECDGGEIGPGTFCPVCDGSMVLYDDEADTACRWAEERGLDVEEADDFFLRDPYGGDALDD